MTTKQRYPLNHFNDFQAVLADEFGPFTRKGAFQYDLRQQGLVDRMVAGERIDDADVDQTLAAMLTMTAYLAERYNRSMRNIAMSAVCRYVDTDEYMVAMTKLDVSQDTTLDQYRPNGVTSSTGDRPDQQLRNQHDSRWRSVVYKDSVEGMRDADDLREQEVEQEVSRFIREYAQPFTPRRLMGGPYGIPNLGPTAAEIITGLMKDVVIRSATEPVVPTPELGLAQDFLFTDEALAQLREPVTNPYLVGSDYASYFESGIDTGQPEKLNVLYGSQVMRYPNGMALCLRCAVEVPDTTFTLDDAVNIGAAKCGECGHGEYDQTTER